MTNLQSLYLSILRRQLGGRTNAKLTCCVYQSKILHITTPTRTGAGRIARIQWRGGLQIPGAKIQHSYKIGVRRGAYYLRRKYHQQPDAVFLGDNRLQRANKEDEARSYGHQGILPRGKYRSRHRRPITRHTWYIHVYI